MRRLLLLAAVSLLAACSPRALQPVATSAPVGRPSGALIGLTASDLGARFGQPSLQVHEGAGTKLQWTKNGCVIDVYLYPPEGGHGADRATFADARRPSGADISVEACLAFLAP